MATFALLIYGDNVRFQAHQKTCDTLNINGLSGHDHHYRCPISYKNAKKGEPSKMDLPSLIMTSAKNDCCSELIISRIMSTN